MDDSLRVKNIMAYVAFANKGQLFTYSELMETGLFYDRKDIEAYFVRVTLPDDDYYTTEIGFDRFVKSL